MPNWGVNEKYIFPSSFPSQTPSIGSKLPKTERMLKKRALPTLRPKPKKKLNGKLPTKKN